MELSEILQVGNDLTVASDLIDISGAITLKAGQKVTIREVGKTPSRWINSCNTFVPEKYYWVKLADIYGIWELSAFVETSTALIDQK